MNYLYRGSKTVLLTTLNTPFFQLPDVKPKTDNSLKAELSWNLMAHGDVREGKWRGNRRMEWVASTLVLYLEHGLSSITKNKFDKLPTSMVSCELSSKIGQFQHRCFHITLNLLLTQ